MASGHPDQAILDFNQAIELQSDFPQAHTNRGNAYLRTRRLDLAIADFRQAGQNPVGGLAVLCGLSLLMVLLVAIVIYRLLCKRSRSVTMGDNVSAKTRPGRSRPTPLGVS
jgi:tetratricopeptide (TPR) repeat protein